MIFQEGATHMKNEGAEQWSAPLMAVVKTWSHLLFQQILLEPQPSSKIMKHSGKSPLTHFESEDTTAPSQKAVTYT